MELLSAPYSKDTDDLEGKKKKVSNLKYDEIALIASIISVIFFIPQLYKVAKTKDVTSFSKIWLISGIISSLLWVFFGVINKIHANVVAGVFFIVAYSFILFIDLYYAEKKK
jgi:MtN3 and saliva related transmembrane protein